MKYAIFAIDGTIESAHNDDTVLELPAGALPLTDEQLEQWPNYRRSDDGLSLQWVEPPVPSLAELKAQKVLEINQSRLEANFTTFTHASKTFACDALSRSDIDGTNGIITLTGNFPPGWPNGWKAVDNSYIAITTRAHWEAFYLSMCATGAANFGHAQALKAALAASTTPEQVAAITW